MRRRLTVLVAALVAAGTVAAADPVEGLWQTEPDDGNFALVQIAPCGGAVCGTIARTFNAEGEYQSENLGRQIVIDMVPQGDGTYEGQVWRPSNDKIYYGTMTLNGDSLRLRGCVLGGLICSAQDWTRVQ
ncbi:MAG: DUF2147 domain-containing protein [Rubellimicrobium sp.]|nr:DUF2147 domain-containing protein [Rubellimicrobium sp.]